MSLLNTLPSITTSKQKRVGRGVGSGKGSHTAGRGNKGQKARSGGKVALWFEGGQLPLIKRLPMLRGKALLKSVRKVAEVTLTDIERMSSKEVTVDTLKAEKIIPRRATKAKVVATGKLNRSVQIKDVAVTSAAQKAIEKAGGSI